MALTKIIGKWGTLLFCLQLARSIHAAGDVSTTAQTSPGNPSVSGQTTPGFEIQTITPIDPSSVSLASLTATAGDLIIQPAKSNFAVYVWRGTSGFEIGILKVGQSAIEGEWGPKLSDGFWSGKWSVDAKFLSWSPDGLELIVETGNSKGTGLAYLLGLNWREEREVGGIPVDASTGQVDWLKRGLFFSGRGLALRIPRTKWGAGLKLKNP